MTLKEAEKKFGIPLDTLKQYAIFGFIKGCKTDCGVSEYCEKDFERLGLVAILLKAGFSPEETGKYLKLTEDMDTDEEQIRMLRKQRRLLLNEIHKKQQLLDCLDFMIWEKR